MKKLAALLAGAMLMMATSAMATPVTLTESQLLTATQVYYNSFTSPNLQVYDLPNLLYSSMTGVGFQANLDRYDVATNTFIVGAASSTVAVSASTLGLGNLSSYDTFQLSIANFNQSMWDVALYIEANDGDKYYSVAQTLNPDSLFNNFSYNLASLGTDISDIKYLGFIVSSNLAGNINPLEPSDPDAFHIAVAPVPEPGTMVLLGAGLLGLAIFGKRRMNKEA